MTMELLRNAWSLDSIKYSHHPVSNLYSDIPESIRRKESELRTEEQRLANYVNFIGEGNASRSIDEALRESEKKVDVLQAEIDGLRQTRDKVFQAPPIEWIQ